MITAFQSPNELLDSLSNADLSAVCFVRDYIELHFDGPVLRCNGKIFVDDRILLSDGVRSGGADTLNRLLDTIGRTVVSFEHDDILSLKICFDGGCEIYVVSEKPGQEFAHYISYPDKRLIVFDGT